MKARIISSLAAFGLVAGLSFNVSAQDRVTDAMNAKRAIKALNNLTTEGAAKFCSRKGYARSTMGSFCDFKWGAALAVYACLDNNYEAFKYSGCFNKAKPILGENNMSSANAKKILFEEGKRLDERRELIKTSRRQG